ncbi:MAG TPA: glycosyltransferase family 2 protein [Puia sp.]|nr:glycosyltransferase family 2 protein [Puia sp.]
MKISIITPSYNQGRFIEDAIQSVLAQNYPDFEHIVIDNCSTDNTLDVLKKYPHIKWVSEPDHGQSHALNKGFCRSTGDILGWLNCDDFYLPGAFCAAAGALQDTNTDGVYSDLKFCDAEKNIVKHYRSHRPARLLSLFHNFISSECFFFKRSIIENDISVQEDLHYCMDQEFAANILYHNYRLKYLRTCFAVFRWQGMNKSLDTPPLRAKRIREGIRIFNRHNGLLTIDEEKPFSRNLYTLGRNLLKPYRLFLKMTTV